MAGEPAFADPCRSGQEKEVAFFAGSPDFLFEAAQTEHTAHVARLLYFALHDKAATPLG